MSLVDFLPILARDIAIAAITVALWCTQAPTGDGAWLLGLLTVWCGFALHEWGHVYGAWRSKAAIEPAPKLWSPFIYHFPVAGNTRAQFLSTSIWGFVATALFLGLYWLLLPDQGAGLIAKYGASVLAILTVVFEFPIAIAVARGRAVPELHLF